MKPEPLPTELPRPPGKQDQTRFSFRDNKLQLKSVLTLNLILLLEAFVVAGIELVPLEREKQDRGKKTT